MRGAKCDKYFVAIVARYIPGARPIIKQSARGITKRRFPVLCAQFEMSVMDIVVAGWKGAVAK